MEAKSILLDSNGCKFPFTSNKYEEKYLVFAVKNTQLGWGSLNSKLLEEIQNMRYFIC